MSAVTLPSPPGETDLRAAVIFREQLHAQRRSADRLFAVVLMLQWAGGLLTALWLGPLTWSGGTSSTHPHVWAALVLGGIITSLPMLLIFIRPGEVLTGHVVAVAQMLWSALLIHLTGGRIETHFHVFGSLAFLAWYRDWKILATATAVVLADHMLRGLFWPQSVYGVLTAAPWRTLEHGGWVLFEDAFLLVLIRQSRREMLAAAVHRAELTGRNAELQRYTQALEAAKLTLTRQAREMVRQSDSLRVAQDAAEQANRLKSEFLANMSHEIRTPMTAILGFTDLLNDWADTPEQAEAVATIRQNGEYLLEIINGILDLSKIESGRFEVEKYRCLPHQIIAEVASLMRVRAAKKNLTLDIAHDGPFPEIIETDPTALRQILLNLIGNAVKFTERGGIRIVVRMGADRNRPQMEFDVVDTGIGMTPEQVTQLFQPFVQVDSSLSRRYSGTGLGLVISKRLAEKLGGAIHVDTAVGRGSTFRVSIAVGDLQGVRMLDALREAARPDTPSIASSRPEIRLSCRVLLAEDGPHNQRFLTIFLERAGARIEIAENGEEAVQMTLQAQADGRPYDVVLMDMQMPVVDGYTAVRRLRAAGYLRPIIALTAHAMSGDREKCLEAGCNDYASKPISRNHLVQVVAAYAEHASPEKAEPAGVG